MEVKDLEKPKTSRFDTILYGKKTVGFPMLQKDLEGFVDLHMSDDSGFMGSMSLSKLSKEEAMQYANEMLLTNQVIAWVVTTKEHKPRTVGYWYLIHPMKHMTKACGIMDKAFAKGLEKHLRRDKYTYAEDASRSLIDFCFNKLGMIKVMSDVMDDNRLSASMHKRLGFKKEGTLRRAFEWDGEFKDVIVYGLLKEEY